MADMSGWDGLDQVSRNACIERTPLLKSGPVCVSGNIATNGSTPQSSAERQAHKDRQRESSHFPRNPIDIVPGEADCSIARRRYVK